MIKTILRALGVVCFITLSNSYASELWLRTQLTTRYFLSIETTDTGLKLNHFSQERGEYQSLISETLFKNKSELEKYVTINYPNYTAVKALKSWPIQDKVENSQDKLFGKGEKNTYIWRANNRWNEEWEQKYSAWLQNEVTPDFFKRFKISTDCADALVGLRWIFARMNSLPVANTIADTGNLFGHFSMKKEWRKYGTAKNWYEDQLFMAALDYIMNLTSTRTVIHDGFPVRIDTNGLVAGTYIITQNNGSGHAKIITETHYDDLTELPLYTLASTSPREIRDLTREVLLDQDWPSKGEKEILAFRWPVVINSSWVLEAKETRATYSEEQFDLDIKREFPAFIQFVLSRVKGSYDPLKLVEMGVNDILRYAQQRASVIAKGYEYCKKNNCRPGSIGDDDWGTTSRDAKLLKKFHDIDTLVKQFENLSPGLYERWMAGLRNATFEIEGVELTLASLRFIMENNLYSSLATDTPARRWGLHAPELLSEWMDEVEKLIYARNETISRPENPCSVDCYPKTNLWTGLSTYHIDAQLNKLYVEVTTYCSLIGSNQCLKFFSTKAQKIMSFNNEVKNLDGWFQTIPYFHSDPRVSIERRWGKIPEGITARVLPYFELIKVAKNSLALLDSTKLMDLQSGKLLYQSQLDTRLILTTAGQVYKIYDKQGEIKRMSLVDGVVHWIQVADPDQLLKNEIERPVYVSENDGYTIFRKNLSDGQIIFRIKDDQVEFIKEHPGISNQLGSLVTAALNKNTMSFIDLDRVLNVDISFESSNDFLDMSTVKISSYKYPYVVLNYNNQDQDLYYSVVVNLQDRTWRKLAPSISEKYLTLWSSAKHRKALIQTKFNSEFPALYAVSWDQSGEVLIQEMSNLLLDVKITDDSIYFISGTGGLWDLNPMTKLFRWDNKPIEMSGPLGFKVKFLTSFGAYYSSNESGVIRMFSNTKDLNLPKDLLADDEFCQIQTKVEEIFSYRFDTSYGDYWCMGGSLLKSQLTQQNAELTPQFSLYSWINKESLLDLRWRQIFAEFEVESGVVIGLGKNVGLWWGNSK